MNNFWNELIRRNVIKSCIAYLVVAWLVVQVMSILLSSFLAPSWVMQATIIALGVGFIIWIIISWNYDFSSKGLVRSKETTQTVEEAGRVNNKLNRFIIVVLSLAVIVLVFNQVRMSKSLIKDDDGKYSIAVLYFDNMSADKSNDWISDGMTETILTKLQPNPDLRVISRSSVKQFRGSDEPLIHIVDKLDVSYIVEGSVTIHNNEARITAQLIDKEDTHVWAKEYNVQLDEILDVQSAIARRIVDELEIVLSPEDVKEIKYGTTNNIEAFELYQKGLQYADIRDTESINQALRLFEQAIKVDSLYAEAYAEAGYMHFLNAYDVFKIDPEFNTKPTCGIIDDYAAKALSINPNVSRAYAIKALKMILNNTVRDQRDKHLELYEKAIEVNPNDAYAYMGLASTIRFDDPERSFELVSIALTLDPMSLPINQNYIQALLRDGNYAEAQIHFNKKRHLFYSELDEQIFSQVVYGVAKGKSLDKKDWNEAIIFFNQEIDKEPKNASLYRLLGDAYGYVFKDGEKYINYSRRAYELDSTSFGNARQYFRALLEHQYYDEAKQLLESKQFYNVFGEYDMVFNKFLYHHIKGEYETAQKILDESYSYFYPNSVNLAYLGRREEVFSLIQNEGISNDEFRWQIKANVNAILKEQDSMFYYLNKFTPEHSSAVQYINKCPDFDPYRKDERFKLFLNKHYLPLTHLNE